MSELNLEPGLQAESSFEVDESMAPPHLPAKVLSTPSMVGLIEGACLQAVQPSLPDNHTTVGTHVDISHSGPAFAGESVQVKVRLEEVKKRRLKFAVEVVSPRGTISSGFHERAVVDLARFG